ncbi:hypothetical protein SAMN05443551_0285 [Marivita hallyeonensis]|uniref:Uncharacterized protein n=1 Tax=Marivita hallyeonensis TaxID=996342 RepID=A0A1M5LUA0_9RHOB|nr:hypothetical protein SAMN05443551_0285 [Marivita hallyeonensis]
MNTSVIPLTTIWRDWEWAVRLGWPISCSESHSFFSSSLSFFVFGLRNAFEQTLEVQNCVLCALDAIAHHRCGIDSSLAPTVFDRNGRKVVGRILELVYYLSQSDVQFDRPFVPLGRSCRTTHKSEGRYQMFSGSRQLKPKALNGIRVENCDSVCDFLASLFGVKFCPRISARRILEIVTFDPAIWRRHIQQIADHSWSL